jgi:hypothetical protein
MIVKVICAFLGTPLSFLYMDLKEVMYEIGV